MTALTASWLGGYFDGSAALSTDRSCGDLVERNCHVVSNRLVALNRQVVIRTVTVVLNRPLRRPHPRWRRSGARRPLSEPGRSSLVPGLSLDNLVVYGSRSSCNARLPSVDDIRAVSGLAVVSSSIDLAVVYQLHAAGTDVDVPADVPCFLVIS